MVDCTCQQIDEWVVRSVDRWVGAIWVGGKKRWIVNGKRIFRMDEQLVEWRRIYRKGVLREQMRELTGVPQTEVHLKMRG
jgi:hypothetical protein